MPLALLHLGRTAAGPLFTLELARAISETTPVCTVTSSDADLADEFERLNTPNLAVPTFSSMRGALTGFVRIPRIARAIFRFLSANGARTVVVTMEQVWQPFVLAYLRLRGVRILLFVHDASPHPGEDGALVRFLRRWERSLADGAVVLSPHVRAELIAQRTFAANNIWVSAHPAFRPSQPPRARQLPEGDPVTVGFFGRMSRYKGLDLGLATIDELRRRGRPVLLRIVGKHVPKDAPGLDHDGTIVDDRFIPDGEVQSVLEQFDIALLPYVEASQSGVLAYTTSLGIPSVVTPVGGLVDQARESGSALVSDSVSAHALADAVERLLNSPELYAHLSQTGIDRARETLTWQRLAADTLSAVDGITLAGLAADQADTDKD